MLSDSLGVSPLLGVRRWRSLADRPGWTVPNAASSFTGTLLEVDVV
ncbi:MAG: hypothetical protein ACRDYE_03310 [Acidimicrobiales bacterium]